MEIVLDGNLNGFRSFQAILCHFWVTKSHFWAGTPPALSSAGIRKTLQTFKCHLKPSPSDFCSSHDCFEWSHDQFTIILSLRPKLVKSGQKCLKKAPNDPNWPKSPKSDIRNHFNWISASLVVILSGHVASLRQFRVWR